MKLKYTNLLGLLAILGTVTGLVGIGIFYRSIRCWPSRLSCSP